MERNVISQFILLFILLNFLFSTNSDAQTFQWPVVPTSRNDLKYDYGENIIISSGVRKYHAGIDIGSSSYTSIDIYPVYDGEVVGIFKPTTRTNPSNGCTENCVEAYTNYLYPHCDTYPRVFNGDIIRDHRMQGVIILKHIL